MERERCKTLEDHFHTHHGTTRTDKVKFGWAVLFGELNTFKQNLVKSNADEKEWNALLKKMRTVFKEHLNDVNNDQMVQQQAMILQAQVNHLATEIAFLSAINTKLKGKCEQMRSELLRSNEEKDLLRFRDSLTRGPKHL